MTFYLGTHLVNWLWTVVDVPLFVSRRRLAKYRTLRPATCRWALDSGGFTELRMFGKWVTSPEDYVVEVERWREQTGRMDWAAAMDWMCEPFMLERTGLTVLEHQRRTVDNFAALLDLAPDLPWTPVIQGWQPHEYLAHVEMYVRANLPLWDRTVGIGSVCRRAKMDDVAALVRQLHASGLNLHAFGGKGTGLVKLQDSLESADSMAWSFGARRRATLPGCTHKTCANCLPFALAWRDRLMSRLARQA